MKTTVNIHTFRAAFEAYGRNDQFSREGLGVIFNYLEEYEEATGEEVELDVVAFCCEYCEESAKDIASNYDIDLSECEGDDEIDDAVREYLEQNTVILGETSKGFVYTQF